MQKGIILSVDDDKNLQTVVGHYLESSGYNVITANSVKEAIEKIDITKADVILLDLTLPDGEGLTLIPQFRSKTNAPIIIVSGKTDTTEKIVCLEMGADDYLTKPFEMRELSARITAVMRRVVNAQDSSDDEDNNDVSVILFEGGWRLDRGQYQLFDPANNPADLTTGEFQLLEALILNPNRALSREHLFDLTREGEFDAYDRAIDIQIARLRKKVTTSDKDVIKTVRGVGYMFCGDLDIG